MRISDWSSDVCSSDLADCVVYMPQTIDADQLCRLLESGCNVVTTRTEFHHPASVDPALRARIEAACQRGGTSIHSTGNSPGSIRPAERRVGEACVSTSRTRWSPYH